MIESTTSGKIKLVRITTVPVSLKVLLRRQLHFMSDYFEVIAMASPGKELNEVGSQEAVRTAAVNMTRSITPIRDAKAIWQLYRFFKKEKPQIVHTHTPKAGLLGMMAAKAAGVPLRLHTVAGMPLMVSKGLKRKILEYTERLTYSSATHIYPNSKNMAEFIEDHNFCAPLKLTVLGNGSSNGIDTEFFKPTPELEQNANTLKQKLNIQPSDFVFVFIGRMVRDKGIEELISAFSSIRNNYRQAKLLLIGPFEHDLDPLSEETRKIIEEDEAIIHEGFQQDVRPYFMIGNVLTFPSYREGFPNVPMQAGCFNLPAIVTNINGCNEIVENGKNGLIIPVRDAGALEKAMRRLIGDRELYLHLQSNARRMIVERYEQKHFWSLLLNEYQEQLKSIKRVS